MEQALIDFLIRAKRATYAGNGAPSAPSRPASHDLTYCEGNLCYIDTYIGTRCFAGEEALWRDGVPVWAMNYSGREIGDGFSGDFLKECLLLVPLNMPFRGPPTHCSGGYEYRCLVQGNTDWFVGQETITKDAVVVYECLFHGGHIL